MSIALMKTETITRYFDTILMELKCWRICRCKNLAIFGSNRDLEGPNDLLSIARLSILAVLEQIDIPSGFLGLDLHEGCFITAPS